MSCARAIFGCLFYHKSHTDTGEYDSGCETEYVWRTCHSIDLNPADLTDWSTLTEVESIQAVKCANMTVNSSDFGVLILAQIHWWWWWWWDRICVAYLCGLEFGISQWLKHIGGSWKYKSCEMRVHTCKFEWFLGFLFGHKYPSHGSGCEPEYVWVSVWTWPCQTCPYLCDSNRLTQDRRMKEVKFEYILTIGQKIKYASFGWIFFQKILSKI
jgi:hypothetical protein